MLTHAKELLREHLADNPQHNSRKHRNSIISSITGVSEEHLTLILSLDRQIRLQLPKTAREVILERQARDELGYAPTLAEQAQDANKQREAALEKAMPRYEFDKSLGKFVVV